MIYTVTFNPALDYAVLTEKINLGETNRSSSEYILTGGKGINVSAMLCNLEIENTVLGFIGGFTGQEIKRRTEKIGCKCDFIEVNGLSRINVKIKSDKETEINACGPLITDKNVLMLLDKIKKLKKGDYLVLAGSVSSGVSKTIYGDIMKCVNNEVKVIVDATGDILLNAVKQKPFLIKPNNYELSDVFGCDIGNDRKKCFEYALKLRELGAENVLVSLAGSGAILLNSKGEYYETDAPKGQVIDSVGAGDSMVAGFLYGWLKKNDFNYAFKMGVAAGSASAFSKGFASKESVMKIYNTI